MCDSYTQRQQQQQRRSNKLVVSMISMADACPPPLPNSLIHFPVACCRVMLPPMGPE
jgi:hypothetical protein